ncbi:MAG: hypothetical protein ACK5LC_10750 [Coprobacillaceae bacterium]
MGKRINVNGIGWVNTVSNQLQMNLTDLKQVNTILSDLDDFLDESGVRRHFTYSYISKKEKLNKLEDDMTIYKESISTQS